MCHHTPRCPGATAADSSAALVVAAHPEQGWSLLCNGVVLFEDSGQLMPDGRALAPAETAAAPAVEVEVEVPAPRGRHLPPAPGIAA